MRFLTDAEAADWARGHSMLMPAGDRPERQPQLEAGLSRMNIDTN